MGGGSNGGDPAVLRMPSFSSCAAGDIYCDALPAPVNVSHPFDLSLQIQAATEGEGSHVALWPSSLFPSREWKL